VGIEERDRRQQEGIWWPDPAAWLSLERVLRPLLLLALRPSPDLAAQSTTKTTAGDKVLA